MGGPELFGGPDVLIGMSKWRSPQARPVARSVKLAPIAERRRQAIVALYVECREAIATARREAHIPGVVDSCLGIIKHNRAWIASIRSGRKS